MKKEEIEAISLLIGCTIGAGVLGIPYVISKVGFLTGLIVLFVIGIAILFMNLFLGEVALRTKGNHQIPGYADIYLGKPFKEIMIVSMILAIYGALIAFLIGEGEAFAAIFKGNPLIYSFIFFIIVTFIVHKGIKTLASSEFIVTTITLVVIALIILFSLKKFDINNVVDLNIPMIFLPYGVVLFAFLGSVSIPEIREELKNNRKLMKRAITIGSIIPLIVYVLFALSVIGVSGINTTQVATIGLGNLLGFKMVLLGNLFAMFAMFTTFITLAYALKEMFKCDCEFGEISSLIITCFVPFLIFLLIRNFAKFTDVLGITGALFGGFEGILIVLIYWRSKQLSQRKPEYSMRNHYILGSFILLMFFIGIILTLFELLFK